MTKTLRKQEVHEISRNIKIDICVNKLEGIDIMIVDVILGNNIDTLMWINELIENEADNIGVINYDCLEGFEEKNGVIYMSPAYAKEYIKKFDTVNFYKSLYCYPGMHGNMSFLYRKNKK